MTKDEAIELLKKVLHELPKDVRYEDALHTYYNNYDVEDLLGMVMNVLRGNGYSCGDYAQ